MRTFMIAFVMLSAASSALAQPKARSPEELLPADCLVYFRYDGYVPHKKAYDQTALARAMKEGLGEFFEHGLSQLTTLMGGEFPPRQLKKGQKAGPEFDPFVGYISRHGFALTLEVAPPRRGRQLAEDPFQITIVFPEGAVGKNRQALEGIFQLTAKALETPIASADHGGRKGNSLSLGVLQADWWPEGKHLVLALGRKPAARSLLAIDGRRANLTSAPWYADFAKFNRFETDMRGRIDLDAVVDHLASVALEPPGLDTFKDHLARQLLLRHLGLTGIKDLTFHLGFDGKYQRSSVRLGVVEPNQRTGLLHLISGPTAFSMDKLPPLPPDADYVAVRHVDWDDLVGYLRTSFGLFAAAQFLDTWALPGRFPDLDRIVGGDFRKDFIDQLDTTVVTWGAHSEGPFVLGQGFAVKVKDANKVRKGLAGIVKTLGETSETLVARKKLYRGQEMHIFDKLYTPITFTVHKDWLVVGLFPQPVQGFLMRSGGGYRVWKAPPELEVALARERKSRSKLLGVSVSDPRPAVEITLALLPIWIQSVNAMTGTEVFSVDKIPNAQSVNEWLFPNITLFYDDGAALRWEHQYSINEPDDVVLLQLAPMLSMVFDFFPFPAIPLDRLPPPRVGEALPQPPTTPSGPEEPVLAKATATLRDGKVRIEATVPRTVNYTVWRDVHETQWKEVVQKGQVRKIPYTVARRVSEERSKQIIQTRSWTADGILVRVTRKDGSIVDPAELPRLLAKETEVLLVTTGKLVPARLEKLAEGTLILRVTAGARD